jgi:hypothetical protein
VDYEYRILLAEKELAHLREMQQLREQHHDTPDLRLDKIQKILHETTAAIASLAAQAITGRADLQTLGDHVDALTGRIDALVKALLREHPNGRSE